MDRKKPALTSPWKVGFLVALLLIVTALGVSYFITGNFGVTWHWIHIAGLSPTTWSFNFGAFLDEMAPLLLLTSLLAFAAYVLVAGAVRRYKSYVDSGSEYKQLLKSIKTIEDLEDEQITDSLKHHPELREFMMSIKNRVGAMERQQADRGRRPTETGGARANERPTLGPESAILASAVMNGKDGFSQDLAITTPELKQIERALRQSFANAASGNRDADDARRALDDLRTSIRGNIAAMRRDVTACATGAREVESSLATLRQGIERMTAPAADTGNASAVLKRVGATADALATLGEETKRVAIATALQASGGSESDAIRVADEARGIATRFNTVAQHWRETAPVIKQMLEASANGGRPGDEPRSAVLAAAGTAAGKASHWGERAAALNEHLRTFERSIGDEQAGAQAPTRASMPDVSDLDLSVPAPIMTAHETPPAVESPSGQGINALDAQTADHATSDGAGFVDIPGFEKERRFFGDDATVAESSVAERFVVEETGERRWDLDAPSDSASDLADEPATSDPTSSVDSEGFITGPRPVVSPARAQRLQDDDRPTPAVKPAPPVAAVKPALSNATATATLDPDADAIDLYALGAIDYAEAA